MLELVRAKLTWWKVRLICSKDVELRWLAAARREGHRLEEGSDEEGGYALLAVVSDELPVGELGQLMEEDGMSGWLEQVEPEK
ncbi:MAG: hypothetical protein U0840_12385 [Gemmataceae bacterium]